MTNKELIKETSNRTGFSQKDIHTVLETIQNIVVGCVKDCGEVKIINGLSVYGTKRPPRMGRNPRTGESVPIPERVVCKAKIGAQIKNELN